MFSPSPCSISLSLKFSPCLLHSLARPLPAIRLAHLQNPPPLVGKCRSHSPNPGSHFRGKSVRNFKIRAKLIRAVFLVLLFSQPASTIATDVNTLSPEPHRPPHEFGRTRSPLTNPSLEISVGSALDQCSLRPPRSVFHLGQLNRPGLTLSGTLTPRVPPDLNPGRGRHTKFIASEVTVAYGVPGTANSSLHLPFPHFLFSLLYLLTAPRRSSISDLPAPRSPLPAPCSLPLAPRRPTRPAKWLAEPVPGDRMISQSAVPGPKGE